MSDENAKANVLTNTRGGMIFGFVVFTLLFGVLGGWMAFANIAGAIIAPGAVAVVGKPKTIQHLNGGVVEKIHVSDEQIVKKGDLLVRLDDTQLRSNAEIYESRLQENLAKKARLQAEHRGHKKIKWLNVKMWGSLITATSEQMREEVTLLKVRRETLDGQVAQMHEKISQYKNQIKGVKGLQKAKAKQVRLLDKEIRPLRRLLKRRNATVSRVLTLDRQIADLKGQLSEHDAELARIQNSIHETQIQILQARREYRENVLTELQKVTQEVNGMIQQLFATLDQLNRVEIRAPIYGMVHQLAVFTLGGVIKPGDPMMQIVPLTKNVEVEGRVEPQFIDELYIGQKASLHFSAFNEKETPTLFGHVKSISPATISDEQTGMTYYTVRLTLPPEEHKKLKNQKLVPGMPVETFIKTKDRTPLNYVLKPLMDQMNRAFREE